MADKLNLTNGHLQLSRSREIRAGLVVPSGRRVCFFSITCLLGLSTILLALKGCGGNDAKPAPKAVTMTLSEFFPGMAATVTIDDRALIDQLIMNPIRNATINKHPARYEVFADVTIAFEDGSTQFLYFFFPIGELKNGDEYYTADLLELKRMLEIQFKSLCGTVFRERE